jgi:hypothetical protein
MLLYMQAVSNFSLLMVTVECCSSLIIEITTIKYLLSRNGGLSWTDSVSEKTEVGEQFDDCT